MKKLSPTVSTASSFKDWVEQSGHGPQISQALAEGSVLMVGKFPDVPLQQDAQSPDPVVEAPVVTPRTPKSP